MINFTFEVECWCYYITSYVLLFIANAFGRLCSPIVRPLAVFWLDYDHGPKRSALRRAYRQIYDPGRIIDCFDCRFMVLSAYCLYPWWSIFISNHARWFSALASAIDYGEDVLSAPTRWLYDRAMLWPPDGWLLSALMLGLVLISHTHVASVLFYYVLRQQSLQMISTLHLSNLLLVFEKFSKFCRPIFDFRGRIRIHSDYYGIDLVALATCLKADANKHDVACFTVNFDSDSRQAVMDNSANTHIWSHREDFVEGSVHYYKDSDKVGVITIHNTDARPIGYGTVMISITDNGGTKHNIRLENTLLFPASPVNIVSITELGDMFEDDWGTWIKTRRRRSEFTWDHEKYSIDFPHPSSRLPILNVGLGCDEFHSFCNLVEHIHPPKTSSPMAFATCHSTLPLDGCQDICFAADKPPPQDRPISSEMIQYYRDESYQVGDRLRLSKNDINQMVDVVNVRVDEETGVVYFRVILNDGHAIEVTKEFLFPPEDDDIASIPVTQQQVRRHIQRLDEKSLEALLQPPEGDTALVKEFMAWHVRSGHLSFQDMFRLCENGYLPRRFLRLRNTHLVCPSCVFGKQKRRPWRTRAKPGAIRLPTETKPGDRTSIDHVISHQPGLVPRMDGRHTKHRINSACVFVDHVSGLSYSHLQTSVDNVQTMEAKVGYEQFAKSHGVDVKSYHADNGVFAEKAFRDLVEDSNQSITFCAVGAHHQNGIVERHIGTLTHGTRTILLHAQRRWPQAIGSILWPFAWKHFERQYNHFHLDKDGKSAMQKFTGVEVRPDLKDFHPFGCPVFVLDTRLQSDMSAIPKWEPRSRVGIYLGHSPCHAGSVALVLNPRTLRVSPQYHIVYDDEFSTVPYMNNGEVPPHWETLVKASATVASNIDFDLATDWANDYINGTPTAIDEEDVNPNAIILNQNLRRTTISEEVTEAEEETKAEEDIGDDTSPTLPSDAVNETTANNLSFPTMPDLNDLTCRRSSRQRKATHKAQHSTSSTVKKLFSMFVAASAFTLDLASYNATAYDSLPSRSSVLQKAVFHSDRINTQFDNTLNSIHHAALATAVGDNDTYTLKDMMKQEDKGDFITAMIKEVEDHVSRNHWTLYERSVMPPGTKTILSVWSFKRKRYPDGRVLKHKARLCAHGGMQTWGVNYWETYAPVVNWLSVRTLMTLSIIHDLEARSIDFVLAFPQADLTQDIWMELPFGFDVQGERGYILKLNKNLYGLKDASRTFWLFLKEGLEARGYDRQSSTDSCVFYGKDAIILVYVDDMIVFSRKGSGAADKLIEDLKKGHENYSFTDDGDLEKYLGVDVKRHDDGRIELTQKHLIQRFLDVIGYDDSVNSRTTPAVKPLLTKDTDGLPRKTDWNYRQAIGMLNYLTGISRPELSMAVHQAARFTIAPMLSHERAVQRIGKYLLGTKDKGIIFRPDTSKGLECFVDADFAGGWSQATATDATTVLSRTGFVISYAGCPILWCSKLQTEIALSTTEAEYIALSQAMREVIPIIELLKEINDVFPIDLPKPTVHCKVWEDNNGCISVAKGEKFSPRTKHIAIKYHHFRSHVKQGTIQVLPIDTKEQTADIFTKPLDETLFVYLRRKLNGW